MNKGNELKKTDNKDAALQTKAKQKRSRQSNPRKDVCVEKARK